MIGTEAVAVIEDSDEDFASLTRALRGIEPPVELIRYMTAEEFIADLGQDEARNGRPGWLVALLDLSLPGKSGRAVLEFMREQERLACLPVVVLSGSAQPAGIEDAYRLGARGYVVKPFEVHLLAQAMATVIKYWRTVALTHTAIGKNHRD
jgi:DNA-binding NarL/FixJ family response regulator